MISAPIFFHIEILKIVSMKNVNYFTNFFYVLYQTETRNKFVK